MEYFFIKICINILQKFKNVKKLSYRYLYFLFNLLFSNLSYIHYIIILTKKKNFVILYIKRGEYFYVT